MFVRVKSTPNSPRKSVQIVHSERLGSKVRQKIIKHVGIAMNDEELEELKLLANAIKRELESKNQLPLYTPDEIERASKRISINKESIPNKEEYAVNLLDILEEDRIVKGIHDIYGKFYDELNFKSILPNPTKHKAAVNALKEIVLARVANPDSKRRSVNTTAVSF